MEINILNDPEIRSFDYPKSLSLWELSQELKWSTRLNERAKCVEDIQHSQLYIDAINKERDKREK
jgi:hypothetical protein